MIMLDIHDMMEKDKLSFLEDLLCNATMELQRRKVQNLTDAVIATEWLFDYDIGFPTSIKSQGSVSHSSSGIGNQLG